MKVDDCFLLGNIIRPHGMKGEVSAILDVDDPAYYQNLESVFVDVDGKLVPFFIEKLSPNKELAIIKFEDIDTIDHTERVMGCPMYLPLSALPPLPEGKFYFHEIIGFQVIDKVEGIIGPIKEVYQITQQDILSVDHQGSEVLIPLHDDFIVKVDKPNREMHLDLPAGLLKVYLDSK